MYTFNRNRIRIENRIQPQPILVHWELFGMWMLDVDGKLQISFSNFSRSTRALSFFHRHIHTHCHHQKASTQQSTHTHYQIPQDTIAVPWKSIMSTTSTASRSKEGKKNLLTTLIREICCTQTLSPSTVPMNSTERNQFKWETRDLVGEFNSNYNGIQMKKRTHTFSLFFTRFFSRSISAASYIMNWKGFFFPLF